MHNKKICDSSQQSQIIILPLLFYVFISLPRFKISLNILFKTCLILLRYQCYKQLYKRETILML